MREFWDSRYSESEYAYGTEPNAFFREILQKYHLRGKILLPADGEGRNGVYAARQGLDVVAVDFSEEGRKKALALAAMNNVSLEYLAGDILEIDFPPSSFDVIAMIFVHLPSAFRRVLHKKMTELLKPGGTLILEGFSKKHVNFNSINPQAGGPKDPDMLFSTREISIDFADLDEQYLEEVEIELAEGTFHAGRASVIRFVGRKQG